MRKKLTALFLTFCLALTPFASAFAADGETPATELPEAANGVITLTENVDISQNGYTVKGNITLDLAGFDLKAANTSTGNIDVPSGATLTLKDSSPEQSGRVFTETDYSTSDTGYAVIYVTGGSFVMESGNIYAVRDDAASKGQFAVGSGNGGSVTIKGGKIEAGWYAISGNGTDQEQQSTINIEEGTLVSTSDYALYLPHNCKTTISGGIVTGAAGGIALRAGTLEIKDGTIASEGTGNTGEWSDGSSGMGNAAVNVGDNDKGLYGNTTVRISGGDFKVANSALSVNLGTSQSDYKADIAISGGSFPDDVSEYVADGCTLLGDAENGYYVVAEGNIPDEDAVASIGNSSYSSLAAAVDVADDGDTITMVNDAQLSSVITIDKAITLDLNGQTITATGISDNANPIQVLKQGELTIKDSAGQGAIEATTPLSVEGGSLILENGKISVNNTTNGYGIYVWENGSVTVNGGEISSTYAPLSGNNKTGDMNFTVNGGTLTATYGPAIYMPGQVSLTITDGTLNGGISLRMGQVDISGGTINAITDNIDDIDTNYNYSGNAWLPDALYVFNGTYTSENAEHGNSLNLNITGGTFTCENGQGGAITIYDLGKVEQKSSITISGEAKLVTTAESREAYQVLNLEEVGVSSPAEEYGTYSGHVKTDITGGMFSKQPDASYIADGYVVVNSGDANYHYLIQQAEPVGEAKAVAEVADPSVDDSQISDLTAKQKQEVVAAAESVEVSSDVMQEQSKDALEEVKKDSTIVDDAVQALNTQLESSVKAEDVTLFVQAYLNITPTEYKPEETTLTFDITPMSRVVASTEKDSEKLVIKGEETSDGPANAVIVGEPKPLTVNKQVTITLTLPKNFIQEIAYVVHTKEDGTQYLYDGTVDASSVLTFINPNGFSNFTVYGADPAVARVYASDETEGETGTGYMTLQQAIGAVTDNGYIVVKKDDSASVSRSISFTVSEENGAVASISAGRGYRMTKVENGDGSVTYTFSRRSSSSSNSGSTGGIGTRLPVADEDSTPSVTGFESDTKADLTVNGRYQFRITSLDGHTPVLTVNNANFTVTLASQSGRDYFYVITCAGTPGSTAAVSVDGKYLLTATVGGSASGVVSDTTHPFTVAQGGTYQFRQIGRAHV